MQMIGVDYMFENGMTDALVRKRILSEEEIDRIVKEQGY